MLIFYQAQLSFLSPDNTGASANQICTDFVPISQLRDLLSCQSTPSILLYQVVTSVLGTLIWMWFNKSVHGTSFTPRWVPNSFYVAHHVKWFTWIFSSGILSLYPCKFHQAMRVAMYSTSTDFGSTHSSHDPEIFPLSLRNCIATFHISSFRGSNTGNSYMHHFIFIFPEYIKHQFNALLCF